MVLRGFEWFVCFFLILFDPSVPKKMKNTIFEIPIILRTLNTNSWRTTSAKSINLDIIRKLIKYALKTFP